MILLASFHPKTHIRKINGPKSEVLYSQQH
jgi:hypothetical protein